jgi:hypothetical protein
MEIDKGNYYSDEGSLQSRVNMMYEIINVAIQ